VHIYFNLQVNNYIYTIDKLKLTFKYLLLLVRKTPRLLLSKGLIQHSYS